MDRWEPNVTVIDLLGKVCCEGGISTELSSSTCIQAPKTQAYPAPAVPSPQPAVDPLANVRLHPEYIALTKLQQRELDHHRMQGQCTFNGCFSP
jgi:hypothetical protein